MPRIGINTGVSNRLGGGGGLSLGANVFTGGEMDNETGITYSIGLSLSD